jgi:hypothetical protein
MLNGNDLNAPKCSVRALRRVDEISTNWRYVLPPNVDWKEALNTSFWTDCLLKLSAGDRIDVVSADYGICFQLWVREVIDLANYIRLDARPLFPHNLELQPITQTGERPPYGVVPDKNAGGLYAVVDLANEIVIKDRMDRTVANDLAAARNHAAEAALAEVASAEPAEGAGRRARQ